MSHSPKQRYLKISVALLVVGAIAAASIKLLWQFNPALVSIGAFTPVDELQCAEMVTPNALLSRERVLKLMTIVEGASKAGVRGVLKAPYCKLKPMTVRAGAIAEREVYPLEFDPTIWAVILYEDNNYVGVRLVPRTQQCSSSAL